MKLTLALSAGFCAANVSANEPIRSLQRLTGFSAEILQSGAFNHKSDKWRQRWVGKFQRNADRMERNVSRKCGYYDADIHTFNYEYDSDNACNGITMIINGYSKWVKNHLSLCSEHRNVLTRLDKWNDILTKVLNCPANVDSYTFVIPDDQWYSIADLDNDYEMLNEGESIQISNLCNPDFVDFSGWNCELYDIRNYCSVGAKQFLSYAVKNEHGIWETGLQCPQCGCDIDGAANLNDIVADTMNLEFK